MMRARAQAQAPQVEVDFVGLEMDKKASEAAAPPPPHQPQPRLDRRRSFREICKMDPKIVKSVIASAGKTINTTTLPSDVTCPSPSPSAPLPLPLPLPDPTFLRAAGNAQETTPVTIFYNGTVSVFHLSNQKAQEIIKLAMELESSAYNNDGDLHHSSLNAQPQNILPELDEGDMPIKRSQSLQRFFEKRKERLIPVFPYSYSVHQVAQPHSGKKASSQA